MDNIIKYLNFEDEGLEVLDQRVEKGKRILTIQKTPVPHFCPVCSYRMHSKGITRIQRVSLPGRSIIPSCRMVSSWS